MLTYQNTSGALKVYDNNNFGMWPFQKSPKIFRIGQGTFSASSQFRSGNEIEEGPSIFEYFEFEYVDLLTPD